MRVIPLRSGHRRVFKYVFIAVLVAWLIGIIAVYLRHSNFQLLNPAGQVAAKQRHLMMITVILAAMVIVPVYIMTFLIVWRYHEGNEKATYNPELTGNLKAELVWWGIPAAIILFLSIITWQTSHSLDPRKQLVSQTRPLTIQVVALDWKWLFIYPNQQVASVNYLTLPLNQPVKFDITADAPMNSFWIPQLGGQIYAMPGMATQLNLVANKAGDYDGSSANISGKGFDDMRFTTHVTSDAGYQAWIQSAKSANSALDLPTYDNLAKPDTSVDQTLYSSVENNLFQHVILKYMAPGTK
jgi:cytochrome o ubiquinol oxidase subunit 2